MTSQQITVSMQFYKMVMNNVNPWSTRTQKEIEEIQSLAEEFSKVLREWVGSINMATIVERNKAQKDSNICHSHDFCDANMAMEEAFTETFGYDALPEDLDEGMSDHTIGIWNEAWDLAKSNNFYFKG